MAPIESPGREQPDDFHLALRQLGEAVVEFGEGHLLGERAGQVSPARANLPQGRDEQRGIVVLGDIALRPGGNGARRESRIVVHAEDHNSRRRVLREDARGEFEA